MSNKLQQLKKKLLSSRPVSANPDQKLDCTSNIQPSHMSPQPQLKENLISKSSENQLQIAEPKAGEDNKGLSQSPEVSSPTPHKQARPVENIQIPLKAAIEQNKESQPKVANQPQDIQDGEIKKTQQVLKHKEQPAANLDLVDKYPFLSCSVDDEVKAPVTANITHGVQKANVPQKESKQQQLKQKIVLKELEFVKESIRNLRSAVKGLQKLQKMAAQDPTIKDKIKGFLKQLSVDTRIVSSQ